MKITQKHANQDTVTIVRDALSVVLTPTQSRPYCNFGGHYIYNGGLHQINCGQPKVLASIKKALEI